MNVIIVTAVYTHVTRLVYAIYMHLYTSLIMLASSLSLGNMWWPLFDQCFQVRQMRCREPGSPAKDHSQWILQKRIRILKKSTAASSPSTWPLASRPQRPLSLSPGGCVRPPKPQSIKSQSKLAHLKACYLKPMSRSWYIDVQGLDVRCKRRFRWIPDPGLFDKLHCGYSRD